MQTPTDASTIMIWKHLDDVDWFQGQYLDYYIRKDISNASPVTSINFNGVTLNHLRKKLRDNPAVRPLVLTADRLFLEDIP